MVVLLTSILMVLYRDIRFVIPMDLQSWMYLMPIAVIFLPAYIYFKRAEAVFADII